MLSDGLGMLEVTLMNFSILMFIHVVVYILTIVTIQRNKIQLCRSNYC